MNTTVTSLPLESAVQEVGALSRWFRRVGMGFWRALEAAGQARAQRHILALADRCEALQPDLARELRAASRQGPLA